MVSIDQLKDKIDFDIMNDQFKSSSWFELIGISVVFYFIVKVLRLFAARFYTAFLQELPPKVVVPIFEDEINEILAGKEKFDPKKLIGEQEIVHLWDPSTMDYFGSKKAMKESEVKEIVDRARVAQSTWKLSTFATRKKLMKTMLRYITENQEVCARVAVRDSGKTLLDALIGEVLVTCEKLAWLADSGEKYLVPEG